MRIGENIFGDAFIDAIAFSLSKPITYKPKSGTFAVAPNDLGYCRRECEQKECECLEGDCPESECWGSRESCECYDELTGGVEGLGGRCERGTYCLKYPSGEECTDCCQPDPEKQTCRADWSAAQRDGSLVGGWNRGNTCPEVAAEALSEGQPTAAPTCGCLKGRCTFRIYGNGQWFWYCLEDISKEECEVQMKGVTVIPFYPGEVISNREIHSFVCCSQYIGCPPCDREECPEGTGQCDSNESLVHVETNDGILDRCACLCKKEFEGETSDGEKVCVECGQNSSWDAEQKKCKCNEDYETPEGGAGYEVSGMEIASRSSNDTHRKATAPDCVSKAFQCSHQKANPFYNERGNPMWVGSCSPVDKADRVQGKEYFDNRAECETSGCETGTSGYTCVDGECGPSEVEEAHGGSGSYANISDCRTQCELHKCESGECIRVLNPTEQQKIESYPSKKACTDGISGGGSRPACGSKWFCRDFGGGQCTQSSPDLPIPNGALEFADEPQCLASCGKWFCDDSGQCKQFDGSGPQPSESNNVWFDGVDCSASGCGKLYCDENANECKKATGSAAQGKSIYYENNTEGANQCYEFCTCPTPFAVDTHPGWSGLFPEVCTVPEMGSSCEAYDNFMTCLLAACRETYENCEYENVEGSYISCTGGQLNCLQVKTVRNDGVPKKYKVCKSQTYYFWAGPADSEGNLITRDPPVLDTVSVCLEMTKSQADQLGLTTQEGDCTNNPEPYLVTTEGATETPYYITYTPC